MIRIMKKNVIQNTKQKMARVVSKRGRKSCIRRVAKALHKKAKTLRQHQKVVGKASKRCAKKRVMKGRRRTGARKPRKVSEPVTPQTIPTPEEYRRVYEEAQTRPEGVMTPETYEETYKNAFNGTPCDTQAIERTARMLSREAAKELGVAANSFDFQSSDKGRAIAEAEATRVEECRNQGFNM